MASDEHKITAPLGVENIASEQDELEKGLRITAWAEDAWPDYIAVEDRITGRIRYYKFRSAFIDAQRLEKTTRLLEDALATIQAWGATE